MRRLLLILLGALLLSACSKDKRLVDLTAVLVDQPARGGAKVYIDDNRYACWHNGDYVNVNGNEYTLSVEPGTGNHAGHKVAKILEVDESSNGYTAGYPTGCISGITEGGTSAMATVLSVQPYIRAAVYDGTGDVYQQLLNPMIAYCSDEDSIMKFHNVACVLKVTILNSTGYDLDMHFVTVEATSAYLAGSSPVSGIGTDTPAMGNPTSGYHGITVDCSTSPIPLNDGDDTSLYVVSAPFSDQILTVRVLAKDPDGDTVYYTLKATSAVPLSLSRNQMGQATFEIDECTCKPETDRCNYAFWGCGTEPNPFLITSESDLLRFQGYLGTSENVTYNKGTVYYRQIKDLDVSGSTWTNTDKYFWAHYDGGGYSIKLALATAGGFVARVYGAEFKNLTLTGTCASTTGLTDPIGAFANYAWTGSGTAKFENCTNKIPISRKQYGGGFVGMCRGAISLKKCTNDANITGNSTFDEWNKYGMYFGGFIGNLMSSATLVDCTNNGSVSGGGRIGGMVGGYDNAAALTIKGFATNNGNVSSTAAGCGGILGGTQVSFTVESDATVTNNGVISNTGGGSVGGIIGKCGYSACQILGRAINNNTVSSTANDIGGILGTSSVACTVYSAQNKSTGSITGYYRVGGIIGWASSANSIVSDCRNSGAIRGDYDVGGIAGLVQGSGFRFIRDTNNNTVTATGNNTDKGLGGIIGRVASGGTTVDACAQTSDITSSNGNSKLYVGGIVGLNLGTLTVQNSGVNSTCTITSKNCRYGVAGIAANKSNVTIRNSYCNATLTFTGTYNEVVSGIVTLNNNASVGTITVENCYFGGSVSSFDNVTSYGSMACRRNSGTRTISHCYSISNYHKGSNYNDANNVFTGYGYVNSSASDMVTALNSWVTTANATLGTATYSSWLQSTSEGIPTELPHF